MSTAQAADSNRQPPPGLVLWQGPSRLDGQPIVAIVTGLRRPSSNRDTGPMLQVWILRADLNPVAAARRGADRSVCGDCPLRNGACYVRIGWAPLAVYQGFRRGAYAPYRRDRYRHLFFKRAIRIGAYGDPAAVPSSVWRSFLPLAGTHTGYTHRWADCDPELRQWLMASVDTPEQFEQARSLGWHTFRIRLPGEPLLAGEFVCPKSAEGGRRLLCIQCGACKGGAWSGQATPAIVVHGAASQPLKYERFRRSLELVPGPATPMPV
jgi:hypothetical protein